MIPLSEPCSWPWKQAPLVLVGWVLVLTLAAAASPRAPHHRPHERLARPVPDSGQPAPPPKPVADPTALTSFWRVGSLASGFT